MGSLRGKANTAISKIRKCVEPVKAEPPDKANHHELIRLTIMGGLSAATIAIIAWLFSGSSDDATIVPSRSTIIVTWVLFLLAVTSFSYIMLTGLFYAYVSKHKGYIGMCKLLEMFRQKAYNFTVKLYWVSFFMIGYFFFALTQSWGWEQAMNNLNNISWVLAVALWSIVIMLVVLKSVRVVRRAISSLTNHTRQCKEDQELQP